MRCVDTCQGPLKDLGTASRFDHLASGVQACRRPQISRTLRTQRNQVTSKKSRTTAHDTAGEPQNEAQGAASVPDFEGSLAELEAIVEKLEQGELSLDESLQQFERGVQLTRVCQHALKQAEHKVEILLRKSGQPEEFAAAPFESDDIEH